MNSLSGDRWQTNQKIQKTAEMRFVHPSLLHQSSRRVVRTTPLVQRQWPLVQTALEAVEVQPFTVS